MTIHVNPDWWKTLFDEIYLVTDARTVGNDDVTRHEIDAVSSLLPMSPGDRILDLCGGHGRHTLELCRRGYRHCTVLDYSEKLLRIGKQNADHKRYKVRFVQGDARWTRLESESFDHVLVLGNSMGYINDPDADLLILRECLRLLKPEGWLLLDVADGQAVKEGLSKRAWHEIGDEVIVCRERELRDNDLCAREVVLSKRTGLIRDATYCIRLYRIAELAALLTRAGYQNVTVHSTDDPQDPDVDLGCMNHRLLAVGRKSH